MGKKHDLKWLFIISTARNLECLNDKYINIDSKYDFHCLSCDYKFKSTAYQISIGKYGCRKCAIKANADKCRKKDPYFLNTLGNKINAKALSPEWKSYSYKYKWQCNNCNWVWSASGSNVSRKQGCPNCAGKIKHDSDLQKLANRYNGKCLSKKYILATARYKWKCANGHIWESTYNNIQQHWCPICNESKGERRINDYLIKNGLHEEVDYHRQYRFIDCKYKRKLPFDFYIPFLNLIVEYDGDQHFKEASNFGGKETLKRTQHNDSIKTAYCQQKGIKLLRIPYWELNNIETILEKELNCVSLQK